MHREESTHDGLNLGGSPGVLGCTLSWDATHTEYCGILGLSCGKELKQDKRDWKVFLPQ